MSDFFLKAVLLTVGGICGLGGRRMRLAVGIILGRIMILSNKKRFAVTLENLKYAFPEKPDLWRHEVARKAYRNLGLTFAEIAAFPRISDTEVRSMIEYENIHILNEKLSENKGLILLSGHFGNWELLAYSAGLLAQIPITIVVKPQRSMPVDALLNTNRIRSGNRIVPFDKAARTVIAALRNGEAVALLADQAADADRDVFVDFFGRPAATYEAPATLALRTGSPVVIGFAVRQTSGKYRVKLEEVFHGDLPNSKDGIIELTRRHTAILERAVREHPDLWAWQHKRWKYNPPRYPAENKASPNV